MKRKDKSDKRFIIGTIVFFAVLFLALLALAFGDELYKAIEIATYKRPPMGTYHEDKRYIAASKYKYITDVIKNKDFIIHHTEEEKKDGLKLFYPHIPTFDYDLSVVEFYYRFNLSQLEYRFICDSPTMTAIISNNRKKYFISAIYINSVPEAESIDINAFMQNGGKETINGTENAYGGATKWVLEHNGVDYYIKEQYGKTEQMEEYVDSYEIVFFMEGKYQTTVTLKDTSESEMEASLVVPGYTKKDFISSFLSLIEFKEM